MKTIARFIVFLFVCSVSVLAFQNCAKSSGSEGSKVTGQATDSGEFETAIKGGLVCSRRGENCGEIRSVTTDWPKSRFEINLTSPRCRYGADEITLRSSEIGLIVDGFRYMRCQPGASISLPEYCWFQTEFAGNITPCIRETALLISKKENGCFWVRGLGVDDSEFCPR